MTTATTNIVRVRVWGSYCSTNSTACTINLYQLIFIPIMDGGVAKSGLKKL
jgi:hypothetical protein